MLRKWIRNFLLLVCVCTVALPSNLMYTSASGGSVTITESGYTHTGTAWNEKKTSGTYFIDQDISMIKIDGVYGFCIQPWQLITTKKGYVTSTYTGAKRALLEKIVYYGWKTSKQTKKDYAVTQLMIWEEFGYHPKTSISNYASLKENINAKIKKYATRPSFSGKEISIKAGETITLKDTNNVLQDFVGSTSFTGSGITMKKEGNNLIIKASETPKGGTYSFLKPANEHTGTSLVCKYDGPNKSQQVFLGLLADPIKASIKINVVKPTVSTTAYAIVDGEDKRSIQYGNIEQTYTTSEEYVYYDVKEGDTLEDIYAMYDEDFIKENNTIESIQAGDRILVEIKEVSTLNPYTLTQNFKDKVKLTNLVVGNSYTLTGKMIHKKTNTVLKTSSITFKAEEVNPTKYVNFKDVVIFDNMKDIDYRNDPVVFYEYLSYKDTELAKHEDKTDKKQTIQGDTIDTVDLYVHKKDKDSTSDISSSCLYSLFHDEACTDLYQQGIFDGEKLVFSDIITGTYYLKEVEAPSGYYVDPNVYTVQVNIDDEDKIKIDTGTLTKEDAYTYAYDVYDTKIKTNFNIIKVDEEDNPISLDGFIFSLYTDEEQQDLRQRVETKDAVATFTDVEEGTYYLVEEEANMAYHVDPIMHKVEVVGLDEGCLVYVDGKKLEGALDESETLSYYFKDTKKQVELNIVKVLKGQKEPILHESFAFTLYSDKECTKEVATSMVDEETGIASFILPYTCLYEEKGLYLKETKCPSTYVLDPTVYFVEVDEEGICIDAKRIDEVAVEEDSTIDKAFTYYFENDVKTFGLRIHKQDLDTHTNIKDKDFVFGVFKDEACKEAVEIKHGNTETGDVVFTDLVCGTYYVQELEAPKGYQIDRSIHVVSYDGTTFTLDGEEIEGNEGVLSYAFYNQVFNRHPVKDVHTGVSRKRVFPYAGACILACIGIVFLYKKREKYEK